MRSTMQTITNVSYAGRAVDTTAEPNLTFTNNCDSLSYVELAFRDKDTGTTYYWQMGGGIAPIAERGSTVSFPMSGLSQGKDYTMTPIIFQSYPDSDPASTSPGKYDVFMGAGRVQEDSDVTAKIYIDKDIPFIMLPTRVSSDTVLVGGCAIQLSDRTLLITAYDPSTGEATVAAESINGTTGTLRTTSQGEPYKLITNYLICDSFAFSTRALPSVSLSLEVTVNGLEVTGTYSQAQGVTMASHRLWCVYSGSDSHDIGLTIDHETQYGYTIADVFPLAVMDDEHHEQTMTVYCEVTTQDGMTVTASDTVSLSTTNLLTIVSADDDSVEISGLPAGSRIFVWRSQSLSNAWSLQGYTQYVGTSNSSYTPSGSQDLRYEVIARDTGHNITVWWRVCAVDSEGNLYFVETPREEGINVPKRTWSLRKLTKTGYQQYTAGNTEYEFTVDLVPGAIETVTNSTAYGSEGRYPKTIKGNDRYDTGSFTAVLGSLYSPEATAAEIDSWNSFISQGGPYLLKTEAGEVKIVAITGNPSRQYGTSLAEMGITRVTYEWTEIDDARAAVIE